MADMTITIHASFPDLKMSFNEGLMLAMVQYLSECLCELMAARDEELENILGFHRKRKPANGTEMSRRMKKIP